MYLEILPLTTCGFSQDNAMLTLLVACPSKFNGGPGTLAYCNNKFVILQSWNNTSNLLDMFEIIDRPQ